MPALHYAITEDETHEPTGMVIRTLPGGVLDAQIIKGSNEDVNTLVSVLMLMIKQVGIEAFLPMARSAGEAAGFDVDAMLPQSNNEQSRP